MKTPLILLTVVMAAVLSGCQTTAPVATPEYDETSMNEKSEWTAEEIAEMEAEGDGEMMDNESASEDIYMAFTQEAYDSMLGEKPFALFFHAKWCGECKALEKDLIKNLSSYPEGVIILKADYDTETELKEEFDVKVQTTFVIFDAEGNVVVNKPIFDAEDVIAEMTPLL